MLVRFHGESSYSRLWRLRRGGSIAIPGYVVGCSAADVESAAGFRAGEGSAVPVTVVWCSPPDDHPDGGSAREDQGN
ncbi:hypothetical protein MGAST_23165 [Mycobacterium gastri 'Wayne']|nr:hypothetical protein MGAST_23165 [Mycobacterium gastri 'Wayne']